MLTNCGIRMRGNILGVVPTDVIDVAGSRWAYTRQLGVSWWRGGLLGMTRLF